MAVTQRKTPKPKVNDELFCSFCGKSQHDVAKLIAGPTVYICDECTELCDDIIWTDRDNRIALRIRTPVGSAYDDLLNDVVAKILDEAFPSCDVQYEFRTPDKHRSEGHGTAVAVYTISSASDAAEKLQEEVKALAIKLSVMNQKFVNESERAKRISSELSELKMEYLDVLRQVSSKIQEKASDLRAVMFLDISGFSKFTFENKQSVVDMLRGIIPPLIGERGGSEINMWGDAIVATFTNPSQAIASSIKFLRHLSVEQLDARIGMAWGSIRTSFNPATGRKDIDGPIVDFAARLEPMAALGTVLCSTEFSGLDIDEGICDFIPVKRAVRKDFADKKAGDEIDLLEVKFIRN